MNGLFNSSRAGTTKNLEAGGQVLVAVSGKAMTVAVPATDESLALTKMAVGVPKKE